MANSLASKLTSTDFEAKIYVRDLTLHSTGVDDLLAAREKVQKLSEETNGLLKKNVYKNYTQFIDTAKEISYLESEMYQLSHMLTEQQEVLNSIMEISVAGGKSIETLESTKVVKEDNRKHVSFLLEKVEGCAAALEETDGKVLYFGELMELSFPDCRLIQKVYCVLLSDGLMIAGMREYKKGPMQYRYQTYFELDSLAIVNVKDDTNIKNTFKILLFPDSRMFQCATSTLKTEWLTAIEQAKKKKMSKFKRKSSSTSQNPFAEEEEDESGTNPFDEEDDVINGYANNNNHEIPLWLAELPEDLDVCIAQREFENAVNLVHKAYQYLATFPKNAVAKDMKSKIDGKVKNLIGILKNELKPPERERSMHGGSRASQRAVSVLLSLGKSSIACDLFLKLRSRMIKFSLKQQTLGGATPPYIEKLCSVFFMGIVETGKEYSKAFGSNNSCASAFVLWSKFQLHDFIQIFSRHVFTPQVPSSVSAECISHARTYCDRLSEIGMDLSFELNNLLYTYVERLVTEMRDKLLEAVKLRANEDLWQRQNHQSIISLKKYIEDMREFGIEGIDTFVEDVHYIALTSNTTSFAKMYINFVDDLLKLYTTSVHILINDALVVTFQAQINHLTNALLNVSDKQFIGKNAYFLCEHILPLADKRYSSKIGHGFPRMRDLELELNNIKRSYSTSSSRSSISKKSTTVFV